MSIQVLSVKQIKHQLKFLIQLQNFVLKFAETIFTIDDFWKLNVYLQEIL